MDIGDYGQKIAPVTGLVNKKIIKMSIAPVTGPINKNIAFLKLMQPNGSWSDRMPIGRLGDVNGDGIIDIIDYTLIRQHYEGTYILTGAQFVRADVNRDGVVDETDYNLVRDYILAGGS